MVTTTLKNKCALCGGDGCESCDFIGYSTEFYEQKKPSRGYRIFAWAFFLTFLGMASLLIKNWHR